MLPPWGGSGNFAFIKGSVRDLGASLDRAFRGGGFQFHFLETFRAIMSIFCYEYIFFYVKSNYF
jgi:hypothetical protein